jgi:hypothetical protein
MGSAQCTALEAAGGSGVSRDVNEVIGGRSRYRSA